MLRGADRALLGVLPLYRLDGRLLPIGAGATDHSDALLAPEAPPDAAAALLRTALRNADRCELTELPPGADLLAAAAPSGWVAEEEAASPCPVLVLGRSLEASVPAVQRRKLRMAHHRADRTGPWQAVLLPPEDGLAALARLHGARWEARGQPGGVLADPRMAAFLAETVPALAASGAACVHALHLGGTCAAAALVLRAPGRWLLYLGGFDPARRFESPGTLLIGHLIKQAIADRVREIDFLRGAEAYKYAWGAQDRCNTTRRLRRA
jgi:CelD/BcsL family acetyltransferase involved in cellulose biosynthesis